MLCVGQLDTLQEGWEVVARAIASALDPAVDKLLCCLAKLMLPGTDRFADDQLECLRQHVQAALALSGAAFCVKDTLSLKSICKDMLHWTSDRIAFKQSWLGSPQKLCRALPSIRQAVISWRHQMVNTWEATGYRLDDEFASQLVSSKPLRVEVDGEYVVDVLDSQDLACAMLHTHSNSAGTRALDLPGKHTIRLSRYCKF